MLAGFAVTLRAIRPRPALVKDTALGTTTNWVGAKPALGKVQAMSDLFLVWVMTAAVSMVKQLCLLLMLKRHKEDQTNLWAKLSFSHTDPKKSRTKSVYRHLQCSFFVKRESTFFVYKLIFPQFLFGCMALLQYWIPAPEKGD